MTDSSTTISQIADFFDDANRERLRDLLGKAVGATEDLMTAVAGLILADKWAAFAALTHVHLATRAIADLGGDNGRLVIFYQKIRGFLDRLRNLYRSEQ